MITARIKLVIIVLTICCWGLLLAPNGCPSTDNHRNTLSGSSGEVDANLKNIIKANESSIIDTSEYECEVLVPAEAVEVDTEVDFSLFQSENDLPKPLPEGCELLGGANLKPTNYGAISFASNKEADCYIILPHSVKAEELSPPDIKLMEFISAEGGFASGGDWVIVLPNKNGKIITTGPKAGYIGPDESAPAKLTGVRPWCWVKCPPPNDPPDIILPEAPTGLVATAVNHNQIDISWDNSENSDINGYKIYRNAIYITSVTGTSYSDTGLLPSTNYTYTIAVYDEFNNISELSLPASATTFSGKEWISIAAGASHTLAIKNDGTLWAWGNNAYGQLGLGHTINRTTPIQVGTDTDWMVVAACHHHNHTVGIKTDGTIWVWGSNNYGQLGLGDTIDRTTPSQMGTDNDWISVAVSWANTMAVKANGTMWVWGWNNYGNLGLGDTTGKNIPVQFGTNADWKEVFQSGWGEVKAIKSNDTVWRWCPDPNGGNVGPFLQTGTVTGLVRDACGWGHIINLNPDGTLWAWGMNSSGQLGLGDKTDRFSTIQIGTDTTWVKVVAGSNHTIAIKKDGTLWSWGANSNGQLGLGNTTSRTVPTQVE